jgi:hypothetical protein
MSKNEFNVIEYDMYGQASLNSYFFYFISNRCIFAIEFLK